MTARAERRRRMLPFVVAVGVLVGGPAGAEAAGGPPGVYGSAGLAGIVSLDGGSRFVALHGGDRTVVERIATGSGDVERVQTMGGYLDIPAVGIHRASTGLSADGGTLLLVHPYVPLSASRTRFVLLDTERLRVDRRFSLPGAFTVDAISPDGSRIYMTEYQSPRDPTAYAIRAYDVSTGQLLRKPVIDPTEPEEQMRGAPVSRVESPDGRWAYTLYDANGGTPFIHALDTASGTARCIDIDPLAGARRIDRYQLQVAADGGTIEVVGDAGPAAFMDASTFAVSGPESASAGSSGGTAWWLVAAAAATGLAVAVAFLRRRRRRLAPT